jgi:hypothetical protein
MSNLIGFETACALAERVITRSPPRGFLLEGDNVSVDDAMEKSIERP